MSRALDAAHALVRSAEVLAGAIYDEDYENLEAAIEARAECFEELAKLIPDQPPQDVKEVLLRLRTLDRKILAAAQDVQDGIRSELEGLSTARRAARAFRPQAGPPRFIAKRV